MDTIRHLLLWVESEHLHELPAAASREELAYHAELLFDAGLAEGRVHYAARRGRRVPDAFHIQRLTSAGHDFLDAARDDRVWRAAKETVLKPGVSWTFELLKDTLRALAKQQLARIGLPGLDA